MSKVALNRKVVAELQMLAAQELLTRDELETLTARYPTRPWDLRSLIRWLTLLGAVTAGIGLLVLAPKLINLELLVDGGLALIFAGALWGARLARGRQLIKTAASLELIGGLALQGLTFALAAFHSTGSKDWPSLVGIDTVLLVGLAYLLKNRLVLILACVNAFVWFGGETGYISGWGAYWLGMNYPARFIAAGAVTLGLAWGHYHRATGPIQGFSRVYAHFGLLVIHLALWFLALFGYFEEHITWSGNAGERLLFTLIWAGAAVGCLVVGSRSGLRLIRGYGLVFLIINVYTFYFQFLVANSASLWWLHLILAGGSMISVGIWLENQLSIRKAPDLAEEAP